MYVITGATGHTGHIAATRLLERGKKVRVLGRSTDRLNKLASLGAEPFVSDLADQQALATAFAGAEAVYVMIPPDPASSDPRGYQDRITDAMAAAIEQNRVKHVVVLSSIGADKKDKTGPIVGLRVLEDRLKGIAGLNTLAIRAGYFMENTLPQAAVIQQMGVTGGPLNPDLKLPMIATRDIGAFAADALLNRDFSGFQTREVLGERDIDMNEVTTILGRAIGQPDLHYRQLTPEQFQGALTQMGMSRQVADLLVEMSKGLNSGHVRALEPRSMRNTTPTAYEQFAADTFAPAYQGQRAAA
jgi:uncharacterized protein YbjT (DUF2867 family)